MSRQRNSVIFALQLIRSNFWVCVFFGAPFILVSGIILNISILGHSEAIRLGYRNHIIYLQPFFFSVSIVAWAWLIFKKLLEKQVTYTYKHKVTIALLPVAITVMSLAWSFIHQGFFFTIPIGERYIFFAHLVSNQGNLLATPLTAAIFWLIYKSSYAQKFALPNPMAVKSRSLNSGILTFIAFLASFPLLVSIELLYWLALETVMLLGFFEAIGYKYMEIFFHPFRQIFSYLICTFFINLTAITVLRNNGFTARNHSR